MTKFFVDGDLSNADWTKATWDLIGTPQQIADSFAGQDPEHVATLPVMVRNPEQAAPVLAILRHKGGSRP